MAGQQAIKRRRCGIQIGLRPHCFALDLLRRGEQGSTEEGARLRQSVAADKRLGQPKVADLDAAVRFEKAVGRLHITVDDSEAVRLMEAVNHIKYLK